MKLGFGIRTKKLYKLCPFYPFDLKHGQKITVTNLGGYALQTNDLAALHQFVNNTHTSLRWFRDLPSSVEKIIYSQNI